MIFTRKKKEKRKKEDYERNEMFDEIKLKKN